MSADDKFVSFVEVARRMLFVSFRNELQERSNANCPSWSWVCKRILTCCKSYPSGVTSTILLSELYEAWLERVRVERYVRFRASTTEADARITEAYRLRKQKQSLGANVTTIDSILERKFVSLDAVLDVIILDIQPVPGSAIYLLTIGDAWSINSIEMYLHSKYFDLVDNEHGIVRKSREVRLTGCRLRNSSSCGSVPSRLLPTELLVVLLDEESEEDCLLLGAKFCNDYFSSIQLSNIKAGMDYHFYARVENIAVMALQGQQEQVKQHRITLRDDNGDFLTFLLWGEYTSLSNLLSKGSMVAIERPSIRYELESDNCTVSGLWFEYENHTRLYAVPPVASQPTAEEVQGQGNLSECNLSEVLDKGQRILIGNVGENMSNLALYGLVTHLSRTSEVNSVMKDQLGAFKAAYLLRIGDDTGVLDISLYFTDHWSVGEVHVGQIIFICGIATSMGANGRLECIWMEKPESVSLVNMMQLSALLSTSCLHRTVPINRTSSGLAVQVCKVRIGSLAQHGVQVKYCHTSCGRPVIAQPIPGMWSCNFCCRACDTQETVLTFFMTVLLLDTYPGHRTQVYATCSGQAARAVIQAEPEDFCSWSEIDQGMYLYGLENEQFLVTLFSGLQDDMGSFQSSGGPDTGGAVTCLRIGQALKAKAE